MDPRSLDVSAKATEPTGLGGVAQRGHQGQADGNESLGAVGNSETSCLRPGTGLPALCANKLEAWGWGSQAAKGGWMESAWTPQPATPRVDCP